MVNIAEEVSYTTGMSQNARNVLRSERNALAQVKIQKLVPKAKAVPDSFSPCTITFATYAPWLNSSSYAISDIRGNRSVVLVFCTTARSMSIQDSWIGWTDEPAVAVYHEGNWH